MTLRFFLFLAISGCLLLTTPIQGQHSPDDLEIESNRHPERFKQLVAFAPAFNMTIEQLADRGRVQTEGTWLRSKSSDSHGTYLLVEQVYQAWDALANGGQGDWVSEDRTSFERDDAGFPTVLLVETRDPDTGEFVPSFRRTTTRDTGNSTIENLDEEWNPDANDGQGAYEPLQRSFLALNDQGNVVNSITEFWDEDLGAYVILFRSTNTYDSSGQVLEERLFESALFGPLAPALLTTYKYDGSGRIVEELVKSYNVAAAAFENWSLRQNTFDGNGERTERLVQAWDPVTSDWVNQDRRQVMFSPNSANPTEIVETDQIWDPSANAAQGDWLNEDRSTATLSGSEVIETDQVWDAAANDGQGDWLNRERDIIALDGAQILEIVSQIWDAAGKNTATAWVNDQRTSIEYDERGLPTIALTEAWDGAAWMNESRLLQTFEQFGTGTAVGDDILAQGYRLEANYPNPFSESTTIDFTLPQPSHVRLELFDMLGRRIITLVDANLSTGTHNVSIDGASLTGGLYIYRLDSDRFAAAGTMLLVK